MDWLALLVTQVVLVMDWVMVQGENLDAALCLEKGFNSAKLLCSSCEDLKQFDLGKVSTLPSKIPLVSSQPISTQQF